MADDGPRYPLVIGGTRAGKMWLLMQARERAEHPKGVVQGEVLDSKPAPRGELEEAPRG